MNKKLLPFLFLAVVTFTYFACKKADDKPVALGPENEYYPLQKGKYIIYDVDSTIWNDTFCVTVLRHRQIMHMVADTFTDAQGRLSFRIETRIREKIEHPWKTHEVYYVTNTGTAVETVHNELRFVNLQYPIQEGASWKGNAYVNVADQDLAYFRDWDYVYTNVGSTFNTDNVIFDKTITVNQRDETIGDPETLPKQPAMRNYGKEVFAAGIGMVYREYIHWTYDPTVKENNDPNNDRKCRRGTGVIMRAVDHN